MEKFRRAKLYGHLYEKNDFGRIKYNRPGAVRLAGSDIMYFEQEYGGENGN